jgi:hypothetical protein
MIMFYILFAILIATILRRTLHAVILSEKTKVSISIAKSSSPVALHLLSCAKRMIDARKDRPK